MNETKATSDDAEPAAAAVAVEPQAADGEQTHAHCQTRRRVWRILVPALVAVSLIIGLVLWLMTRATATAKVGGDAAAAGSENQLPERPAFQPGATLMQPAATVDPAQTSLETVLARVPGVVQAMQSGLQSLPSGAAPAGAVVLPGVRQEGNDREIPSYRRWEILFNDSMTLETYARQLDFFGIELGIVGGTDEILYLSNLSQPTPDKRTGPANKDRRLYLTWSRGSLREADELLAARAEVTTKGKIVALFCSDEVEQQMAEVEQAYARKLQSAAIRKTVFSIKPNDAGFEFVVQSQIAAG